MKNLLLKSLAVLTITGSVGFQSAQASVQIALNQSIYDSTTNPTGGENFYDSGIFNKDLIEANSSTLVGTFGYTTGDWQGNAPTGVNDGSGGHNFSSTVYLVNQLPQSTSFPETLTFTLNTGAGGSATGYSISEIQSIAGWNNNDDGSQNITLIQYKTTTDSNWATLAGNFDNEIPSGDFGLNASTQTLITNSGGGAFLNHVIALQFTYAQPTDGANSTLLHELDVVGSPTVSVPEPSTWAMMLAGLGVLLFVNRSRRKQNV